MVKNKYNKQYVIMKNLKTILEFQKDDTVCTLPKYANFVVIDVENEEVSFHKESDIKNDKEYFGAATKTVLELKPMESFEDSINIYIRVK